MAGGAASMLLVDKLEVTAGGGGGAEAATSCGGLAADGEAPLPVSGGGEPPTSTSLWRFLRPNGLMRLITLRRGRRSAVPSSGVEASVSRDDAHDDGLLGRLTPLSPRGSMDERGVDIMDEARRDGLRFTPPRSRPFTMVG